MTAPRSTTPSSSAIAIPTTTCRCCRARRSAPPARFSAASAGDAPLELAAFGQAALGANDIEIIRDGDVDSFDTEGGRRGAGVLPAGGQAAAIAAMPFAGDGRGGFAAVLDGGERMVLTRQALVAGRSWLTAFRADGGAGQLICGFVLDNGNQIAASCAPDAAGNASHTFAQLPGRPIAFFVEAPAGQARWLIDDVALESCSAPCTTAVANAHPTCRHEACGFACNPGFAAGPNGCYPAGQ